MGQFEGTQTSQSLYSAPSQYQYLMKLTVKGLHNVIVYIDDLSVHNSDLIIHQASLQSLFDHLQKANLKIKFNKMSLWLYQRYISWFLFNTCRHFTYIQNFALISSPLNVLTPKDTYRYGGPSASALHAFNELCFRLAFIHGPYSFCL
jgi:hypothetical protein